MCWCPFLFLSLQEEWEVETSRHTTPLHDGPSFTTMFPLCQATIWASNAHPTIHCCCGKRFLSDEQYSDTKEKPTFTTAAGGCDEDLPHWSKTSIYRSGEVGWWLQRTEKKKTGHVNSIQIYCLKDDWICIVDK